MTSILKIGFISAPKGLEKFLLEEGFERTDKKLHRDLKDFKKKGAEGPLIYCDKNSNLLRLEVAVLLKIHYENSNSKQLQSAYNLARKILSKYNVVYFDPVMGTLLDSAEYRENIKSSQ